jgi:hypothetical protein
MTEKYPKLCNIPNKNPPTKRSKRIIMAGRIKTITGLVLDLLRNRLQLELPGAKEEEEGIVVVISLATIPSSSQLYISPRIHTLIPALIGTVIKVFEPYFC